MYIVCVYIDLGTINIDGLPVYDCTCASTNISVYNTYVRMFHIV